MSKFDKHTTGLKRTTTGQTTRQVDSMAYAYDGCGEAWDKQDEKDMAAASAANSHVAFKEAYRLEKRGLRNKAQTEKEMGEVFGFNPAVSEKQRRFMAAEHERASKGEKTKTHMSQASRHDFMRKPKGGY